MRPEIPYHLRRRCSGFLRTTRPPIHALDLIGEGDSVDAEAARQLYLERVSLLDDWQADSVTDRGEVFWRGTYRSSSIDLVTAPSPVSIV